MFAGDNIEVKDKISTEKKNHWFHEAMICGGNITQSACALPRWLADEYLITLGYTHKQSNKNITVPIL